MVDKAVRTALGRVWEGRGSFLFGDDGIEIVDVL